MSRNRQRVRRIILIAIAILIVLVLVRFATLGHGSKSGESPGLVAGTLTPCPDKPNCVCSEPGEDEEHQIEPLDFSGVPREKAWGDIPKILEELGGEIAVSNDEYIAATFSSAIFGFVDDVECRLDAAQEKIQIRSASRVGHSDMGVNRKRVEAMARLFDREIRGAAGGAVE